MEKRVVVAAAVDSHSGRRNCLFSSLKRILGQRTKKINHCRVRSTTKELTGYACTLTPHQPVNPPPEDDY